jgi:hypothetical protein
LNGTKCVIYSYTASSTCRGKNSIHTNLYSRRVYTSHRIYFTLLIYSSDVSSNLINNFDKVLPIWREGIWIAIGESSNANSVTQKQPKGHSRELKAARFFVYMRIHYTHNESFNIKWVFIHDYFDSLAKFSCK